MKVKLNIKEMNKLGWSTQQKLDYYCNLNDNITMAKGNRKLGSQIVGFSLPAIVTCRPDAPCKKTCYTQKGPQRFPTVLGTYYKNLRIYNETQNKKEYFDKINAFLKYSGYKYMRFFDSGDLPDKEFLNGIFYIARTNPKVKFMMFTKRYEWVNEILCSDIKPKNLCIIFSAWNKEWIVPNPFNLPMSYVSFKNKKEHVQIPEDSFLCKGFCSTCFKCWNLKNNQSICFKQH